MAKTKSTKQKVQIQPVKKDSPGNNNVVYILLGVICLIFVILCFQTKFVQDDSYITFRYVENFINGHGLVFNIGEKVEGYTNFLWLILLSVFALLGMNIIDISQYLSVGFGVMTLIMTYKVSSLIILNDSSQLRKSKVSGQVEESPERLLNLIPVILTASVGAFQYWSISGMETSMFVALCLLAIYYYLRDMNKPDIIISYPLVLFLASLTRPEGQYVFGIIILHKIIMTFKVNRSGAVKELLSRNNLITYAVYIVPTLLFMLFRLAYYGYPFPNTFYAKTGFSAVYLQTGWEYFWDFASGYLLWGIAFISPLFLFKRKEIFSQVLLLFMLYFMYTIYVISIGGDVLPLYRFFYFVGPLVFILFGKVLTLFYFYLRSNVTGGKPIGAVSLVLIGVIVYGWYNYSSQKEEIQQKMELENGLVAKMQIAGEWFNTKQQEKGEVLDVGATTIGALSYYAGNKVNIIDMLGLTDEEVAHNPQPIPEISEGFVGWKERNYNVDYMMSRDPDFIYFSTGIKPSAYAERALFTNDEFIDYYYPYYFTIANKNFTDIVYKRKTDAEVQADKRNFPPNPNYKKSFINNYTGGMNLSRDKAKINDAIALFQKTIAEGPAEFGTPYQFIGELYLKQGDKQKGLENLQKAIEVDDYNVLAHYYLYTLKMESGDSVSANIHIQKIMQYSPEMLQ
jgi:arabinofuranosyltransferase